MTTESKNDRLLNGIIVYGFACAFGLVIASSQALQPAAAGFSIDLTWNTVLALVIGSVLMVPCFHTIVHSPRKSLRRGALVLVVLVGLGAFFYPMRVVPRERWLSVFTGLVAAIFALSILAGLLLTLYRFFESEDKRGRR